MKNNIISLIVVCLVLISCEKELDYQLKIDNRLLGKDNVSISHVNPATGIAYTETELAALDYNPNNEDYFIGPVDLTLTVQSKPLSIEVLNKNIAEVISTIDAVLENGNYVATFNSSVADLGVGIGDNVPVTFKVTYDNSGENGFNYNAVLSTDFIIRDKSPNLALNKSATASAEAYGTLASNAVDGNTNSNYPNIIHTNEAVGEDSWLEVDLGAVFTIRQVNVWNRTDCCGDRLSNYHVFISDVPFTSSTTAGIMAQGGVTDIYETTQAGSPTKLAGINATGRYIRIQQHSTDSQVLAVGEIEIY